MGKVALCPAGLTKRYGRAVVLGGLDLKVGASQVHAFLGPNGAGPPAADQDPPGPGNVFRHVWHPATRLTDSGECVRLTAHLLIGPDIRGRIGPG
jgi:hypothetical protein